MSGIDLWYTTRATGIVALVLLTATTVLGILVAGRARSSLPAFARADLHRRLSALTVVFLGIHVLTAVLDTYVHLGWASIVVPFTSDYDRFWVALGTIGADLLLAVAVSSALRGRIPAGVWRAVHWLAYLSWPVAVSHTLGMGTDTRLDWMLGLVGLCVAAVAAAAAWRLASAMRARAARPATIITPRPTLRRGLGGAAHEGALR